MSYLSEKKELEEALRTQELEYKRDTNVIGLNISFL